jgi:hypothetical protein
MCDYCSTTLIDYMIQHTETACPLRASQYCSNCALYGHLTKTCPAKSKYAVPTYVEQLIPPSLLKEYDVKTLTPLTPCIVEKEESEYLLEIKDNEKAIRAYLITHGIQPTGKMKDNKDKLQELAKKLGRRVVFINA